VLQINRWHQMTASVAVLIDVNAIALYSGAVVKKLYNPAGRVMESKAEQQMKALGVKYHVGAVMTEGSPDF
jgi:hypothetical protein